MDSQPYNFTGRLAQWRVRLSKFEFDVVYRTGIKGEAPVALSQLNTSSKDESALDDDLRLYAIGTFDNLPVPVHNVAQDEDCT